MVLAGSSGVKAVSLSSFLASHRGSQAKIVDAIHTSTDPLVNVKFPRTSSPNGLRLADVEGARIDVHASVDDVDRPAEGRALGSGGATFPRKQSESGNVALEPEETSSLLLTSSSVPRRWSLLHKVQKLCRPADPDQRGPAVCGCGRPGYESESINIHLRTGRDGTPVAGVSGVYRCRSPWLCPACAPAKAHERAERVQGAADATYRRCGAVALVVLTASHRMETSLSDVKKLIAGASRKARQGRAWTSIQALHGILGSVVGQEVTVSRVNGWHYHQHLSVLIEPTDAERTMLRSGVGGLLPDPVRIGPPTFAEWTATRIAAAVTEAMATDQVGPPNPSVVLSLAVRAGAKVAGETLAGRYKDMIRKAGGTVSDEHGCRVRVAADANDASLYTSKGSLAWEVSGGHKNETKNKDSLTPWDLAESAFLALKEGGKAAAEDKWARARWSEYVSTMPGTRSCVVSAALAASLGIASADDKETGEQVLHEADEVVGRVEVSAWTAWMRFGLVASFLARVEAHGEVGCDTAIAETEADAARIEAVIARRRAARAATAEQEAIVRHDDLRACLVEQAAARVAAEPGAGTRARVDRAIAATAAANPTLLPPTPEEIIRALSQAT